jgi:hypothetical protein
MFCCSCLNLLKMENARGGNRHGLSAVFFEKIGCLIGRHGGPDGWITELSVGQVMAACRAEVDALGLHAPSFRIRTGAEPEPGAKTNVLGVAIAAVLLAFAAFWVFGLTSMCSLVSSNNSGSDRPVRDAGASAARRG